jgi:hypothetical protein
MTRRRLWTLVALACLALAVPAVLSLPRERAAAWTVAVAGMAAAAWARLVPALAATPAAARPVALALLAGAHVWAPAAGFALALLLPVLWLRRRSRDTTRRVRRMGRRRRPVSEIARRTGLAQDAVRDLLGTAAEPTNDSFADLLYTSSTLHDARTEP